MPVRKNTAFLLIQIQILVDFDTLTWWETDTFKLVASLPSYFCIFTNIYKLNDYLDATKIINLSREN